MSEALLVLDNIVLPNLYGFPEEMRIVAEQNRVEVTFARGGPVESDFDKHYEQVDRRRLAGVTFSHADALLEAAKASEAGRNFDSLPVYYASLFDAYRQFNWRGMRHNAEYVCRELLRVAQPVQALFYAVLSEDKAAVQSVAEYLRALNDSSVMDGALTKLTEVAHLRRHLIVASEFIRTLGDSVPDRYITEWLERLQSCRHFRGATVSERWLLDPAWTATTALLGGAGPSDAVSIIEEVLHHPRWAGNDVARDMFYEPLEAACRIAAGEACKRVVRAVLPHVLTDRPGHDSRKALRLLIAIAQRSPELKRFVATKLYAKKTRALSQLLAAVATEFDRRVGLFEPEKQARAAVAHLRLQVERLPPGGKPQTGFGEMMVQQTSGPAGVVAVKFGSSADELVTLAQFRKDIPPELRADLVTAILETISDPENINKNRRMLFDVLALLSDSVDSHVAEEIVHVAIRYAGDHRNASHPLYGHEEGHALLNPYRFDSGWPQDVRGAAILAVAQIGRHHPQVVAPSFTNLLFSAMADPHPTVRRAAYRAVSVAGSLAASCLPAIVAGTRDADAGAANVALQVVGMQAASVAAAGLVPLVLGVIEAEVANADVGVRRATATVVRQLRVVLAGAAGTEVQRLDVIAERLNHDVSRSVRHAITSKSAPQTALEGRTALRATRGKVGARGSTLTGARRTAAPKGDQRPSVTQRRGRIRMKKDR
jgi:hypothetical protein